MAVSRISLQGGAANVAGFNALLPTRQVGDLVLLILSGKYDDTTIPTSTTAPSGSFTLLGSATGGTGSPGTDVGKSFIAVYGWISTDTSSAGVSAVTWGATPPNSACYFTVSYRPSTAWRDTVTTSAPWVVFADDTNTASPLTATAAAFAGQPTTGDALFVVGAVPTDSGSVSATSTLSATGLSGGTQTRIDYVESTTGADSAQVGGEWVDIVGTATSGVTASLAHGGGDHSGPIAFIAIRETHAGIDLSVAGTMPSPTLAVSLAGFNDSDLSVAATMPLPTLAVALDAPLVDVDLSVAATMPLPTLDVDLSVTPTTNQLAVAGTMPLPTLAVSLTGFNDSDLTVAATMPLPTLLVELEAAATTDGVSVAGTMPLPTLAVDLDVEVILSVDTSNADDGIFLGDGLAEIVWEPDVVAPPVVFGPQPAEVRTVARVIDTAPGVLPNYTPAVARTEAIPGLRVRVLIGDEDWSFYRDVPVQVDDLKFIDPLLYGSGQLTLPQINPQYPDPLGDLRAYFLFKRVTCQLVLDGDPATIVDPDYYHGFVTRVDTEGHQLGLMLGGQAAGRLAGIEVRQAVYKRRQNIEHVMVDLLRDARVRARKTPADDGFGIRKRSGGDSLSIFNELRGIWEGATDSPITFLPDSNGVYVKSVKDTETIDFTVFLDSSLVSQSLSQDFMEQPNRVYAQGWTLAGELVTNIKTPGLTQINPPDFPNDDESPIVQGDEDADTDSGAGVTAIQEQLAIHNHYDVNDGTPGVYDDTVAQAVEELQFFAGLNVTGEVGPNTWAKLWNLNRLGYSLDDAREYPMAEDPAVRKWNRTSNGSKIEANPLFDPHMQPVDTSIDAGGPFNRRRIRKFAQSKLAPEGGVWRGTLTVRSGFFWGDVNPGDPITPEMVGDRRELKPNMRGKLVWFNGEDGVVVTLADKADGPEETTAAVSTLPETTVEAWAAIERLREAKSHLGRQWGGNVRKSQIRNDLGPQWDTTSGRISNKRALTGGQWTEIKVPAGQAGIVQTIRMQLEAAAEFAVILTQKPLAMGRLNTDDGLISFPLVDLRPSLRPWWENDAIADWLEARGVLKAWGTAGNPCGYGRSQKTDDQGETGVSPTGFFREEAGFNYETGSEPVLYLYVWVEEDNFLLKGRVLRNQRTTDF